MDQDAKKKVLRSIPYGLYALGVRRGDAESGAPGGLDAPGATGAREAPEAHAMTVNWLTQCSFEPPMVAVAMEVESASLALVRAAGGFAVSVLPAGARQLAGRLGRASAHVPDKLAGVAHHPSPVTGSPVLEEATGWLDCRVVAEHACGDHVMVFAEVVEAGAGREAETLTLKETGFRYAG